jgi:hypothetical protein
MSHSKFKIQNPNFPLPRSGPFTAKPGFFLGQVVGDSMNRRDSWSHRSIRLEPDSMNYNFKPLTLDPRTVNELRALGEFVGIIN